MRVWLGVAVGLVLSPIAGVLFGSLWYKAVGGESATVIGALAGIAVFVLGVWKGGGILTRILGPMLSTVPDPVRSCIEFGVVGVLLSGGVTVGGILALGHVRPQGWDFDRVLPVMGLGGAAFLLIGLAVGVSRIRKTRRSSGKSRSR